MEIDFVVGDQPSSKSISAFGKIPRIKEIGVFFCLYCFQFTCCCCFPPVLFYSHLTVIIYYGVSSFKIFSSKQKNCYSLIFLFLLFLFLYFFLFSDAFTKSLRTNAELNMCSLCEKSTLHPPIFVLKFSKKTHL